jgi:hypothetical protein
MSDDPVKGWLKAHRQRRDAAAPEASEERTARRVAREAEKALSLPAWMLDKSLLPKRPPGQ